MPVSSLLSLHNYIDRASVTVASTPSALAGLPVTNLKVPWLDGIARGASSAYDVSFSWELGTPGLPNNPWGDTVDVVALIGINWRTQYVATLKWWNTGGSWSSPLGTVQAYWYLSAFGNQWPMGTQRNIFLPLPGFAVGRFWRLDVTLASSGEIAAYPWEARRLWCGPAVRFGQRKGMRTTYGGTQAAAVGETGIPTVSKGKTFRKIGFAGRALPRADMFSPLGFAFQPSLQALLYDRGLDSECLYIPRYVGLSNPADNGVLQSEAIYGRLLSFESVALNGLRYDISGEIQEVPVSLPSPLVAPN